jgi:hypothetical protein
MTDSPWLRGVAIVAIALALLPIFKTDITIPSTSLYLIVAAVVALILPEIQKFSVSKDGVSFEKVGRQLQQLDAKVDRVTAGATELSAQINSGVGGKVAAPSGSSEAHSDLVVTSDDPQAGKWGGKSEADGRRATATVAPSNLRKDWFKIDLLVESTTPARPLTGTVQFHLHPSFREKVIERPAIDGRARLELIAWGAFTVGVSADGGKTKLELDLSKVADAPEAFRTR